MSETYKVKVGEVEGPLDLILSLIEKRKLHISDVSLSEITDGYLEYIEQLGRFPVEDTVNFISVASTLILIKSISLLPDLQITEEERESIDDLNERLRLYKEIKDKSAYVKEMFGNRIIFSGGLKRDTAVIFTPTREITLQNILASVSNVLSNLPKLEKVPEAVIKKVMSLEEAICGLVERIKVDLKTSFHKLYGNKSKTSDRAEKVSVIVNFLAMLELVRRGLIFVKQDHHFQDIDIETGKCGAPVYN
ncbi:MAG: segregation/condensation protein A [Candidatus Vogelbacteria bacterium]|nr:segregation/condensation protein A [Candidatus Vogelbacteria bacterium]